MPQFLSKHEISLQQPKAPTKAENLAGDLLGIMESSTQALNTYNTIGATAAKTQAQEDARAYHTYVSEIKASLADKEHDPESWTAARNAIQQLSAEYVAKADTFKNHSAAFDAYANYALDNTTEVQAAFEPLFYEGYTNADINKWTYEYKELARTSAETPSGQSIIDAQEKAKFRNKDIAVVESDIATFNLSYIDKRILSYNGNELFNLVSTNGVFDDTKVASFLNQSTGSAVKYIYDSEKKQMNLATPYQSDVVKEQYMARYNQLKTLFSKYNNNDNVPNFQFRAVNQTITSNISKIESGSYDESQSELLSQEATRSLFQFEGQLGETDLKSRMQSYQNVSDAHNKNKALQNLVESHLYTEEIRDLSTRGASYEYSSQSFETGKIVDTPVNFTSSQINNAIKTKLSNLDAGVVDSNGNINEKNLKNIMYVSSRTGIKSPLMVQSMKTALASNSPYLVDKKSAIAAIEIAKASIESNVGYRDVVNATYTSDYFESLNAKVASLNYDPKNPAKFVQDFNDAKASSFKEMNGTKSVKGFVVSNLKDINDAIAKNVSEAFDSSFEFGTTEFYDQANSAEYARQYGIKYGTQSMVDKEKLFELTKENSYTFGNSIPLFGSNYKIPHIREPQSNKLVNEKAVSKAISSVLSPYGIKDKFSKEASVFVSHDGNQNTLNIVVKDKSGRIAKSKTFTAEEINTKFDTDVPWQALIYRTK